MTATTVFGTASRAGGISRTLTASGRVMDAHAIDKFELELPPGGIELTVDHEGPPVGEVVHAELAADERLNIVSVVEGDWLAEVEAPVFYSGVFDCRGSRAALAGDIWRADRAYLIGLSITLKPASLEARPLDLMPGDVREQVDRGKWPYSWRTSSPILARAVDRLPTRGETRARRIIGPPPEVIPMGSGSWLVDGELVTSKTLTGSREYETDRRAPGPLEWRPSRILSVR